MASAEKTFYKLFKKHLPSVADCQRIETGSTGLGIPDLNVCHKGREIWIELKIVKGRRVKLSPEQIAWHHRRNRAGGETYIIARDKYDGPRKGKMDVIYIWKGKVVVEVFEKGIDYPAMATFISPFKWDDVMAALF
jgi:Holliday junction resolvase